MKKIFLSLLCLFVGLAPTALALEKVQPTFDDREWILGWSKPSTNGEVFEEYVLSNEKVESWSELVSIQIFPGLQNDTNLDVFEGSNKSQLGTICPNIVWNSISQEENERFWSWDLSDCKGQPDQAELVRAFKTDEAIHVYHYAIKRSPMPKDLQDKWINIFKSYKIEKN